MSNSSGRLVMQMGPEPGQVFELSEGITHLGRDIRNEVAIADPEVSRQHARLSHTPQGYVVEDLGSTNGTFINDQRLTEPHLLKHGDRLNLSDHVSLLYEEVSPAGEPTVAAAALENGTKPHLRQAPPAPRESARERLKARRENLLPWVYAGCGCLVFLLGAGAVLYWMPQSWWCVLLSPLETVGLYFGGC